jgi:hypothetical protein
MVPGHLQTAAFAEATLAWHELSLGGEKRRVLRDVRLSRRERFLARDAASTYRLLLDESALWRLVGGAEVAADQFEDLAESALRPNVDLRVLPMDDGAMVGMFGAFAVLDLSDEPDDAVLYRESSARDELVEDPAEMRYHRDVFEMYWRRSLDEEASRALILARVYDLRARIARANSQGQGTVL